MKDKTTNLKEKQKRNYDLRARKGFLVTESYNRKRKSD